MKKSFTLSAIIFIGFLFMCFVYGATFHQVKNAGSEVLKQEVINKPAVRPDIKFGKIPLYFISNEGQVHQKARFYAKASRYTLWLTKEGLVFDSIKRSEDRGQKSEHQGYRPEAIGDGGVNPKSEALSTKQIQNPKYKFSEQKDSDLKFKTQNSKLKTKIHRDVSRLIFIGANKNPNIIPVKETKLRVNFFKGNDPAKWLGNIPTSSAVLYKDLYKNIDLKVYGIEKQIEYDWIVKPGGNPEDIRFEYKNVKKSHIDKEGNLVIKTKFGELIHKKPLSYQIDNELRGRKNERERVCEVHEEKNSSFINHHSLLVNVNFKKIGKNNYGFNVGDYDKSLSLVIDPVVLAYSTYLGGSYVDRGHGIAVDGSGYVYVGGETWSADFPVLNQYQYDPGSCDVFITKLDTTQSGTPSLLYSTYLGGNLADRSYDLAVDASGCAYVVGFTNSTDYPTLNQYQTYQVGVDAFVTKLDTTQSGVAGLIYSSYLGGDNDDHAYGVATDSSGYVYVTGYTRSTNFPILNQYQGYQPGADAYVTKLDTTQMGSASLIYSTHLGGGHEDYGYGIAVDGSGHAYVTGFTYSTNYPTLNQFQTEPWDSNSDVFVTKLDTTQSGAPSLLYSTYLGGTSSDQATRVAIDSNGYTYVTGFTSSWNYPTLNQYQSDMGGQDVFVTKLDTTQSGASSLLYSTYLGGGSSEDGRSLAIDSSGYVYVTGYTGSTDFPSLNQYQGDQGDYDVFVTKFDTTMSGASCLLYSTYLGGSGFDMGHGIAVDGSGNAYVTGETTSTNFPTLNQFQGDQVNIDAFVTKLAPPATLTVTAPNSGESWMVGSSQNITWTSTGTVGNVKIEYSTNNGTSWTEITASTANDSSHPWTIPNDVSTQCLVRVSETDGDPTDTSDAVFSIIPVPSITVTSPNGTESWMVGSMQNITWTSTGSVVNVRIEYSTNNGGNWTLISSSTANDGSHPWTIPGAVSSQCLVRVSETDGDPADTSDAMFSIIPVPTITVTSPNGGESWMVGSSHDITWTSTGTVGNLKIDYSTNNGGYWTLISSSTANDGSHPWTIPNDLSSQCLVRVSETDGDPTDTSDAVFSIVPVPSITVTSPNGAESWMVGSMQNITWTSTGSVGNVRIEYSTNNGGYWTLISSSTANDGSHPWAIPNAVSSQCLVRVSETDGDPTDTSDAVFSIIPIPSITVTSPNGGESWSVGSNQTITWISIGSVGNIKIEYTTNNGVSWIEIIASTANDGSQTWTVPATVSSQCLVRVSEQDGNPSDTSDALFTITGIVITSPNGGEIWDEGKIREINWDAVGTTKQLKISLWKEGVKVENIAVNNDLNVRSYSWPVGQYADGTATPGTGYTIKIKEIGTNYADMSDASFIIGGFKGLTSPNGGETLLIGATKDITWKSQPGYTGNYGLALLKDGVKVGDIALITDPAVNSYAWPVGQYIGGTAAPGIGYTIKIKEMGTPYSDVSDEPFELKRFKGVLSPNGGENLLIGTTWNITWNLPLTYSGELAIVLLKDGVKVGDIALITDPTLRSYSWSVGDYVGGTAAPGTGYKIRIKAVGEFKSDLSDTDFSLSLI